MLVVEVRVDIVMVQFRGLDCFYGINGYVIPFSIVVVILPIVADVPAIPANTSDVNSLPRLDATSLLDAAICKFLRARCCSIQNCRGIQIEEAILALIFDNDVPGRGIDLRCMCISSQKNKGKKTCNGEDSNLNDSISRPEIFLVRFFPGWIFNLFFGQDRSLLFFENIIDDFHHIAKPLHERGDLAGFIVSHHPPGNKPECQGNTECGSSHDENKYRSPRRTNLRSCVGSVLPPGPCNLDMRHRVK